MSQLPEGFQLEQPSTAGSSLPEGFELESDKYGGLSGMAQAASLGAVRGASVGLSDPALVAAGAPREAIKGLQEQNPITSTVSEIAGTVLPALVGDESSLANLPGLVSRLGAKAEGAALAKGAGRIAAKGVGFGTEGAVYGLGQSISESALGDHDLLSEKTLANIGLSAALSGGLGAVVGKLSKGDMSSAEDKLAAMKMGQNALPGTAEELISKTGMPAEQKTWLQKLLTRDRKKDADQLTTEFSKANLPVAEGMLTDNEMAQKMASALAQSPTMAGEGMRDTLRSGFQEIDNKINQTFIKGEDILEPYAGGQLAKEQILDEMEKKLAPIKEGYQSREDFVSNIKKITDEDALGLYNDLTKSANGFKNKTNEGRKVISEEANNALSEVSSIIGESGSNAPLANLDAYSKSLAQKARAASRAGDHDVAEAYYLVRNKVENFVDSSLNGAGKEADRLFGAGSQEATQAREMVGAYKSLKGEYKDLKESLVKFASDLKLGKKATTEKGIEEVLERIPNEKFIKRSFDAKNYDGMLRLKEKFPEVFETMAKQYKQQLYQDATNAKVFNQYQFLKNFFDEGKLSSKMRGLLFNPEEIEKMSTSKKWIENLPVKVGPSGTPEGIEYMKKVMNVFDPVEATRMGIQEAGAAFTRKTLKMLDAPGEQKLKTLMNLDKIGIKSDNGMKDKVESLFKKGARPLATKSLSVLSSSDYKKHTEEIVENANNPDVMAEKLTKSTARLYEHAPNLSDSFKLQIVKTNNFLASKVPQPQQIGPFKENFEPSESQISEFNRYYSVVHDPMVAFEQIKNGTLLPETVETLSSVYPKLYNQMKIEVMNKLSSKEEESIPYSTKLSVSAFVGESLDRSLLPQTILANQTTFAMNPGNEGQKPVKPTAGGMKELGEANRTGLSHGSRIG